jgi:hypothetical protein
MKAHRIPGQEADWFYFDGTGSVGPFSWVTLQQLRQGGLINEETQVCCSGDSEWRSLGSVTAHDPVDATEEELILTMLTSSKTPEPELLDAHEYPVEFGTTFIPSSGGFRGDGVLAISPTALEIRGFFALPLVLEGMGAVLFLFILLSGLIAGGYALLYVAAAILVRIAYSSIRKQRRFTAGQLAGIHRKENKIILRFGPGARPRRITLRASGDAAAQQIEAELRQLSTVARQE